jgi:ATP-dependent Lhr-like helicase
MNIHDLFHPAVAAWFQNSFDAPTPAQVDAWPAIKSGQHVLIAAPTGSGKTLAAFLAAIDELVREGEQWGLPDETRIVYVSPLKALSNDINRNLEAPLAGIRDRLREHTIRNVDIRTWVRTGDTPQVERARMNRRPPHIIVTTPESLYILLGSQSGRDMLATTRTLIVDEIHAVAGSKRGSHLSLSLERLEALTGRRLTRIGLSATQQPIQEVARFLVGGKYIDTQGNVDCRIVDSGHVRRRDLAIEMPDSPLEAVMSNEVWTQIYDRLAQLIRDHRTTLVFVNTRRLAERVCRHLSERLDADGLGARDSGLGSEPKFDSAASNPDADVGHAHSIFDPSAASGPSPKPRAPKLSCIAAHHGSLAKELRFDAEQRLKRGDLKALVATASLELGIDIGDVDLVCQLSSPRSINAFLQRVGRSGHAVGATPKGRLFPLSRDDLVECAALLDSVRRAELDRVKMPQLPIDVLAQHIVAEAAARDCSERTLFELMRSAYPFRELTRPAFDEIIAMLADGFTTRRGRHGALLYHDAVNQTIRGRKGARLTAITSGGAIPDTADYQVKLEPEGMLVGTVNEDFAVESLAGDVFQLGNASYRILRVERSVVRVEDARGEAPTIPFWLGEAPGRTDELSAAVSRLRSELAQRFAHPAMATESLPSPQPAGQEVRMPQAHGCASAASPRGEGAEVGNGAAGWGEESSRSGALSYLTGEVGLSHEPAAQLTAYLASAHAALGCLPTQQTIVFERFFDEAGGMQLVIHSPLGSRINRAWGLALRKRFCRTFNFELQAAATEDTIILSLTTAHSFELKDVAHYLHPNSAREILIQALLAAPMFATRWRWTASIALALPRFRGGKKVPPQLARMNAEDLLASVFPDQVACGENLVGDIVVPEHPLVRQTVRDCLEEAMDVAGFERLLHGLVSGDIRVEARDLTEPSPLALEVLSARPYAYLDDAPLEERRTQAVMSRRWMDPQSAADLGKLDPEAIARVQEEAWPDASSADELHDALLWLTFVTEEEAEKNLGWDGLVRELRKQGRVTRVVVAAATTPILSFSLPVLYIAAERIPLFKAALANAMFDDSVVVPSSHSKEWSKENAVLAIVRGRLEGSGPTTAAAIAESAALPLADIDAALLALEAEGTAMRGSFSHTAAKNSGLQATGYGTNSDQGEGLSDSRDSRQEAADSERSLSPVARRLPAPPQWCDRRLLARIHRYTVKRLRAEIEPVQASDFLRFLFDWQHVSPSARMQGSDAIAAVLGQLEGFDVPASAWETEVLPARIAEYDPAWLDEHCLAGRVTWMRMAPRTSDAERGAAPVRSTPITLLARRNLKLWTSFTTETQPTELTAKAQQAAQFIQQHGASFFDEIADGAGLLPNQVEEALAELVALGLVNADSFGGLRALLVPSNRRRSAARDPRRRRRIAIFGMQDAGRWTMVRKGRGAWGSGLGSEAEEPVTNILARAPSPESHAVASEAIEHVCRTLLRRWGVVFWKVLERESKWLPPWRDLLLCLRRLEARGEVRGGRFVAGFAGEQYALPDAVGALRDARRSANANQWVSLSAADPLNLVGIITPGGRLPSLTGNRVLYRDGTPLALYVGGEVKFLIELAAKEQWDAQNALLRRQVPAILADLS